MRRELLLQNSILVPNMSFRGYTEQNLVYKLQLAMRLGLSKSKTNKHLCFDFSTWFVTRLSLLTIPRTREDNRFFFKY